MYEYYFEGRKPSNAQVLKQINKAINQGNDYIEISWGENMLILEKRETWHGWGWIRNISGADLAVKINASIQEQFQRDHFQFIRVGF
jgi:hypothetical protein